MPKHSKKKSKKYIWLPHEVEFLQLNYSDVSNTVFSMKLKKSKHSIATKAFQLGLKKNPNVVECKGSRNPKKYREETELTADIICFYDRRGVGIEQIARDMNCPVRQVEEIIARCKADGSYERFRQQENSGIHFDADSPLFVRVPDSGNTRGGWRGEC